MPDLNEEQSNYLKDRRGRVLDLREKVIDKYTPALFENIKGIRQTILSIGITSGAVAAFSLNLFDKSFVINKVLLIVSLVLMLLIVLFSYAYLQIVLEKENNSLVKILDEYNKAITNLRESIDNVSEDPSETNVKAIQNAEKNLSDTFTKERPRVDSWFVSNIGEITLVPFTIAVILIVFSFVDFDSLNKLLHFYFS